MMVGSTPSPSDEGRRLSQMRRILRVIRMLAESDSCTVKELTDRYVASFGEKVCERTIRRDVQLLSELDCCELVGQHRQLIVWGGVTAYECS